MFGKLFSKSKTHKFNYKEPDVGIKIASEYGGDLVVACVTGRSGIGQEEEKLNEFCSHMAVAALHGDPFGIAISCFSQHGEPFNQHLPTPIRSMPEEAFTIFVELLKNNIMFGYSKSVRRYLEISRDEVEVKANEENPFALWLMGAWYAFEDFETKGQDSCMKERLYWYEKSAFKGYLPAIQAIAGLYDDGDDTKDLSLPTDLKKSAFWYRHGALAGCPVCAYNLGVMYSQGDFVGENSDVAKMWLSLSYKNNDKPSFANRIQNFAKQAGIQLTNTPDFDQDPELNNSTSEFQDAYEDISSSNSGNVFLEWVQNNCRSVKFVPQEIDTWSDIKELELQANDLSELSDDIAILSGLVKLSLFHNNFSIVPEVIFNLTELTHLNLGVNQIAELPNGIARLKKLKILDLWQNQLISLPQEIGDLTNLEQLIVGQNQLISLPQEIGDLINLEQLVVFKNNLTSLPKEIGKMVALRHISIWDNDLRSLPDEILNLNNLETIELNNNNFSNDDVKKWTDRFSKNKCKISFGHQKGNISDPIYVVKNIKGGRLEDSISDRYINTKDGEAVSTIFNWSSSNDEPFLNMIRTNRKYGKISITKGLNAINSEGKIVPINMELNAETPSTEEELIQWVKVAYIETCSEYKFKINPKLKIISIGTAGDEKTIDIIEVYNVKT
jgi:Leucine-rich repeat (LRR) protein